MKILFIGDIFGKPGRDIAQRAIPALVDYADIRGVLHCHSTYSDGTASIPELVEAARRIAEAFPSWLALSGVNQAGTGTPAHHPFARAGPSSGWRCSAPAAQATATSSCR